MIERLERNSYYIEVLIVSLILTSSFNPWEVPIKGHLFSNLAFSSNPGPIVGLPGHSLREGCKKSKWKFKMAFAMKGGVSRGSRVPLSNFEK